MCILKVVLEGPMSQIADVGSSFYFWTKELSFLFQYKFRHFLK